MSKLIPSSWSWKEKKLPVEMTLHEAGIDLEKDSIVHLRMERIADFTDKLSNTDYRTWNEDEIYKWITRTEALITLNAPFLNVYKYRDNIERLNAVHGHLESVRQIAKNVDLTTSEKASQIYPVLLDCTGILPFCFSPENLTPQKVVVIQSAVIPSAPIKTVGPGGPV